jgi:regulator of protease activity HflC (stomatin/prohibitin superfamily)
MPIRDAYEGHVRPTIDLLVLANQAICSFTRDQVPVSLTIYLKWQLVEPLKLATHGYESPYDALRDKTQSILTQIVAHLDYSSMVRVPFTHDERRI